MTKILSVDAETNGLYGDPWWIGAVLIDTKAESIEAFGGMIDPEEHVTDEWVKHNIVSLVNWPPNFHDKASMLDGFWWWFQQHKTGALIVADFGTPVEANLFRQCVALDPETRNFEGPYPLHDLATLLHAKGIDPNIDRRQYINRYDLLAHNPIHDALASGLAWIKAEDDDAPFPPFLAEYKPSIEKPEPAEEPISRATNE